MGATRGIRFAKQTGIVEAEHVRRAI